MRRRFSELGLEVTQKCNLRCIWCEFNCGTQSKNELTTDEIMRLIDELPALKIKWLRLTGGEPLMREDIYDIINHAKHRHIKVKLNTNSTLLTKQHINRLDVDEVQISVDGLERTNDFIRGRGVFKKSLQSIKLLAEKKIPVSVNVILNRKNADELSELTDVLFENGANRINFSRLCGFGRGKAVYAKMHISSQRIALIKAKLIVKGITSMRQMSFYLGGVPFWMFKCEAHISYPFVTSEGYVTPCCSIRDGYSFGNIRQQPYGEIIKNAKFNVPCSLIWTCQECLKKLDSN